MGDNGLFDEGSWSDLDALFDLFDLQARRMPDEERASGPDSELLWNYRAAFEPVWITKEGEVRLFDRFRSGHLANVLNMIERRSEPLGPISSRVYPLLVREAIRRRIFRSPFPFGMDGRKYKWRLTDRSVDSRENPWR